MLMHYIGKLTPPLVEFFNSGENLKMTTTYMQWPSWQPITVLLDMLIQFISYFILFSCDGINKDSVETTGVKIIRGAGYSLNLPPLWY